MPKIVDYALPPGGTIVDVAANNATALDIEQAGADYITVDTTGSGSVIIGKLLTLEGGMSFTGATTFAIPDNLENAFLVENATGGADFISCDTRDSAEKLILVGSDVGTVGVRAAPSGDSLLEVSTSEGSIHIGHGDYSLIAMDRPAENYLRASHGSGGLLFQTGGANTRLSITAAGKVGINDATPGAKFTVQASGSNEDLVQFNGSAGTVAAQVETFDGISGALTIYSASGHNMHRINGREGSNGFVLFNEKQYDCNFNVGSENLANALHVDASADKVGINTNAPSAMLDVKGSLTTALTGTFTATNSSAEITAGSSTAFLTELKIGSAIEIFESTTSRGVFTVIAIASDTALTLDSAVSGLSSSPKTGMTGKTDPVLLQVLTGDSQTAFAVHKPGHIQVMDNTAPNSNMIIGDELCGEDLTTGTRNTFIGRGAGIDVTSGSGNTCIGDGAGFALGTGSFNTFIGRENRGGAGATEKCTMVGADAGNNGVANDETVCIGYQAGNANSGAKPYGDNSVLIGNHACPGTSGDANVIAIGHSALGQGANTAVIGDANIVSLATGGNGVCELGTSAKGFKALTLKNAFTSGSTGNGTSFSITDSNGSPRKHLKLYNAGGLQTGHDETDFYILSTTLRIGANAGNMGTRVLSASLTAVNIAFFPEAGTQQTFTMELKQAASSSYTITWPASATTYTDYYSSGTASVNILWAGGVKHTMSTANNAIDLVQFVMVHTASGTKTIYASVIGQAFA